MLTVSTQYPYDSITFPNYAFISCNTKSLSRKLCTQLTLWLDQITSQIKYELGFDHHLYVIFTHTLYDIFKCTLWHYLKGATLTELVSTVKEFG